MGPLKIYILQWTGFDESPIPLSKPKEPYLDASTFLNPFPDGLFHSYNTFVACQEGAGTYPVDFDLTNNFKHQRGLSNENRDEHVDMSNHLHG
jgi:hypothetical protein